MLKMMLNELGVFLFGAILLLVFTVIQNVMGYEWLKLFLALAGIIITAIGIIILLQNEFRKSSR